MACVGTPNTQRLHVPATPDGGTGIPTGRRLLGRIRHIRYDHMLKRCQAVTDRTVRRMRRRGMFREPVDIAIDKHLVCRYDRFRRIVNTIKSKPKKGTYNFNCLATANCIVAGPRAFLAARLVRRGDVDVEVVSGLIADCRKRGIRIKSLKIDREFFSVDIMDMLEREGIPFMVPAIKTKGVKKAVEEFKDGRRKAASRHSHRFGTRCRRVYADNPKEEERVRGRLCEAISCLICPD